MSEDKPTEKYGKFEVVHEYVIDGVPVKLARRIKSKYPPKEKKK